MKIAVLSDTHENFHNLVLALKKIEASDAEQILFLGDFVNPMIAQLLSLMPIPVFAIWGNNDGEKHFMTRESLREGSNLTLSNNIYDFVEFAGRKIFLSHFPDLAKVVAKSGEFDAVFYGHNHLKNKDQIDDCFVLNPGEVSAQKTGVSTFAIYDTETNDADFIELEDAITVTTDLAKEYMEEKKRVWNKSKDHQY